MVTIPISETWFYLIIGGILGALIAVMFTNFVWPFRQLRNRAKMLRDDLSEIVKTVRGQQAIVGAISERVDGLQTSLPAMEERIAIVAEKVGLKGDLLAWGRLQFIDGEVDMAIGIFTELIGKEPDNGDALLYRGLCYSRKGRRYSQNAIGDLQKATDKRPGDPLPMLALAEAYLSAREPQQAENWASEAIKWATSDRLRAQTLIGRARLAERDWVGAITAFKECPETHPPAIKGIRIAMMTQAARATTTEKKKLCTETVNLYTNAIDLVPSCWEYYVFRAQAYAQRDDAGDWERALEDWKTAERNNPRDTQLWEVRGDALYERSRQFPKDSPPFRNLLTEAKKNYEWGARIAVEPYRPTFRNKLSRVLQQQGEFPAALAEAKSGVWENPDYVQNFMAVCTAALAAYEWKEALDYATKGLGTSGPASAGYVWLLFFRCLARLGDRSPLEEYKSDFEEFVDQREAIDNFDPQGWDWSIASERFDQIVHTFNEKTASLVTDLTALLEGRLEPEVFRRKYFV